jgi:DNA repair photolyase
MKSRATSQDIDRNRRHLAVSEVAVRSILTRTSGYLDGIASHSLQPYRGCSYGNSLCGVGCYVRHNSYVTQGRPWGSFLEARTNAAEIYLATYERERRWAQQPPNCDHRFVIFCASATDPFVPQERTFHITRSLLDAMQTHPPDGLILQTHSHRVTDEMERIRALADLCDVRVHVSIESDRDRLPGLPPPASSVEKRLTACAALKAAGITTIVTVAPLLPIIEPERFFSRIAEVAHAVVLDHFIGGDGTVNGSRTLRTQLPAAMAAIDPRSVTLDYRDEMVSVARCVMSGRVGIGRDGFAGRWS